MLGDGPCRLGLLQGATPLHPAPRLSDRLRVEIYFKRDDLTGMGFGGNKLRALDYVIADALRHGYDSIVTGAGPQSNWTMLAALTALRYGLEPHIISYGQARPPSGNLLLHRRLGVSVRFTGDPDKASVDAEIAATADRLRAAGRHPYVIPRGGATSLGALGYVRASLELAWQLDELGIDPAQLWLATGSCGTQAGLVAGHGLLGARYDVVGVTVSRPEAECRQRISALASGAAGLLGSMPGDPPVDRSRRLDRPRLRHSVGTGRRGDRSAGQDRGHLPRPGLRGQGDGRADRRLPFGRGHRPGRLPGHRRRPDPVRVGEHPGMTAPEGYLGTDARITSGPAPELVEAGYRLETDDAPLLHRGLSLADLAHQVALVEAGAVPPGVNGPLVAALLDLVDSDPADFPYDPIYGDAYNSREREFDRTLGPAAGWLHLGRTRREAGRIAFRMVLRERLLALHSDIAGLAVALADAEQANAATLWADSTYLQPAQPSSFGHYFGHFAEQAVRHLERIEFAYRTADSCPGGAGGAGGTRIPIDRARIAALLGFGAVGAQTRDAMWSVDVLSDAVNAAAAAVLTVDEFAEDLEIFASPAFDYLELDASLCRASVLMPQKRNPYALAVIRGGAGTVIGRATGLLATAKSPSARTDNWLYAYGEVAGTLTLAGRLVRLGTAVMRGIRPNIDVLARGAGPTSSAPPTSLRTCRWPRMDYRTSYKIVGRAVVLAVAAGRPA